MRASRMSCARNKHERVAETTLDAALGGRLELRQPRRGHRFGHDALLLAALLAFVARPLVVAPLLWPTRLLRGERLFVMWSGLKGAVPILLAAFALLEHVDGAERIYGIVFVLVTFSVFVQGATVPFVAGRLGIPMSSEGGSL